MPVFSPLRLIPTSRPWAKVRWGCRWVSAGSAPTAAARNARYCYTRVTKADASGVEADIDVLDEHGAVLLAVQGLRLGTGASETRQQRSGAGRAAADHRMAATRTARGGIRRRRNLAADQHHRHRGCGGHHVDRRAEKPWRALHHHVLATARRLRLKRRTAWKSSARRWIHRCGDPHGTEKRRRRGPVPAAGPRVCAASGAHHPRIAGDPWRAASPVRRDPQRADRAGRRPCPTWSRLGCGV